MEHPKEAEKLVGASHKQQKIAGKSKLFKKTKKAPKTKMSAPESSASAPETAAAAPGTPEAAAPASPATELELASRHLLSGGSGGSAE